MLVGRFAPSPTGHLHLGSLASAVASFCHIKSLGGRWLLRIEDVDTERCKGQYSDSILRDLDNLQLISDGEVLFQSKRCAIYEQMLADHLDKFTYSCHCSRKTLETHQRLYGATLPTMHTTQTMGLHATSLYPRLCLSRHLPKTDAKIRLTLPDVTSVFLDGLQGAVWDNPAKTLGDVVIVRQNRLINYLLACSIDDGLQGITHVMRGLDILPMTTSQLWIMEMCGLPTPTHFYHLPLLHNTDGQKLSKQNLAVPIDTSTSRKASQLLVWVLKALKQKTAPDMQNGSPNEILAFAINNWDNTPLKHKHSLGVAQ